MDVFAAIHALTLSIAFAAPAAWLYRRLKRGDPNASANAWKVFAALVALTAVRLYAIE